MGDLYLDAVCIFTNPLISDPEEVVTIRLIEWLVRRCLQGTKNDELQVRIPRLRFMTRNQLEQLFNCLDEVCRLVGISPQKLKIVSDPEDVPPKKEEITTPGEDQDILHFNPAGSALEEELLEIFNPLVNYPQYYSFYGLALMDSVLICGPNSGKRFLKWYHSIDSQLSTEGSQKAIKKLELHLIRIEDILSPYFGESEKRLVLLFERAALRKEDVVTCICLEGVHYFAKNRDACEDLDRRLLTTLLLLLDSISKTPFLSQRGNNADNEQCNKGGLVIVSTSDYHPDRLPDALIRPGRLNRIVLV